MSVFDELTEDHYTRPPADVRRLRAQAERDRDEAKRRENDRRSKEFLEYHSRLLTIWLYGAVLVPLGVMWLFGDQLDRALRSAGAIATVFTMAAPVAISLAIVTNLVVEVVLDRSHGRRMLEIYPEGIYQRSPKRDRIFLVIQLWRAGAVAIPTTLIWIFSGTLDRAFSGIDGSLRALVAIGVVAACWAVTRFVIVGRILHPRFMVVVKEDSAAHMAELEARWAARDAEREAAANQTA